MELKAFADAWLGGLEKSGILAAGAGAELLRAYRQKAGSGVSAAGLAEFAVSILASDNPARFKFLSPTGPPEPTGHPFTRESFYLRPLLTDAGNNGLAGRFSLETSGLAFGPQGEPRPGRIAGRVVGALFENRDDWRFLRGELRPEPPAAERNVAAILGELKRRGILRRDADVAAMAAEGDWLAVGLKPRAEAVKVALQRIADPRRDLAAPGVEVPPRLDRDDPLMREPERPAADSDALRRDLVTNTGVYGF